MHALPTALTTEDERSSAKVGNPTGRVPLPWRVRVTCSLVAMSEQRLDDVLPDPPAGQSWALRVLYDELAPRVHGYLHSRGRRGLKDGGYIACRAALVGNRARTLRDLVRR